MPVVESLPEIEAMPSPRRFTVEEYLAMADAGVLKPGERVQLINGEIIHMTPMGARHANALAIVHMLLARAVDMEKYLVRPQLPASLSPDSMPEPDVAVSLRRQEDPDSYPRGSDIVLAVEVPLSSLKFDKSVKLPLYAKAGIAEYWIVNLRDRCVEVHRAPLTAEGKYGQEFVLKAGEKASALFQPDAVFEVAALLGDRMPAKE